MKKYYLFSLLIGGLALSACTPAVTPLNTNEAIGDEQEAIIEDEDTDDAMIDDDNAVTSVGTVSYTNRAVGYTLQRPDNWYFRHLIKNEIGANQPVQDYFMTDSVALPALGSSYLGRMVIEVSDRELSEYADSVAGLAKSGSVVGGISADRYAGEKDLMGVSYDVIEYHLRRDSMTYRIMFMMDEASDSDRNMFETFVKSISFHAAG